MGDTCATALPVWKKQVMIVLEEKQLEMDIEEFLTRNGRICCSAP